MHRRSLLMFLCFPSLVACANRAPKPQLKTNDLRSIGMLPIKEWADSGSTAQFNRTLNPPPNLGSAPPPISPSLLGMAIGHALRSARNAEIEALASAISAAAFQPKPALLSAARAAFERRSAPVAMLDDNDVSERVRKNKLKGLPADHDAILDVQIHSVGYYAIGKGLGFSPYFQVTARLIDTVNQGEIIEEFSYEGDYNVSEGDSRYFTTPPTLTQPTLAALSGNAALIHSGFSTLFSDVAEKLVDDVLRVRNKQPRLASVGTHRQST